MAILVGRIVYALKIIVTQNINSFADWKSVSGSPLILLTVTINIVATKYATKILIGTRVEFRI